MCETLNSHIQWNVLYSIFFQVVMYWYFYCWICSPLFRLSNKMKPCVLEEKKTMHVFDWHMSWSYILIFRWIIHSDYSITYLYHLQNRHRSNFFLYHYAIFNYFQSIIRNASIILKMFKSDMMRAHFVLYLLWAENS